jgi:hypothetical protein
VRRRFNENPGEMVHIWHEEMMDLKKEVEDKWRLERTFHDPYNWTRRLIEGPLIFCNRRRKVNYHVMQILTGHGIFNWYRHRIGKGIHTSWWDCGAVLDDAVHALVWCSRWTMERADLEAELGEEFKFENLVLENMAADERPFILIVQC